MRTRTYFGRGAIAALAASAGVCVALATGLAQASASHQVLKTAKNASVGATIAVDSKGLTVYELKPETIHHLLCKSAQCFSFWPPVTAPAGKLTAAKGIKGKLGTIRRGKIRQLTLGGVPLYHFKFDTGRGSAAGNGIQSFGGTWHVVKVSSTAASTNTNANTTPTNTTPTITYGY
jgi:predicted lipoprotein with Yx(FWY)xxD motif